MKKKVEKMKAFLFPIYRNQELWWKSLVLPNGNWDLSEEAICKLYSPNQLLTMDLSSWTQESVNDAPCYYIAYNMACAYSRLKNGKESISWLEVAFKLNKELKNLAVKDNDLTYVRDNHKKDFGILIK